MTTKTMAEEAIDAGVSTFRGHPIVWRNDMWVYADDGKPIPGWGGEVRPCIVCGQQEWSGDGAVDNCLGLLPGVSNACCGHGDPTCSYIQFTNGLLIRGFRVVEPRKEES